MHPYILLPQSMAVTMSDGSVLPLDGAALKEALQYRLFGCICRLTFLNT